MKSQQISNLWERTKGGKGQVALLCGEAGIESIRHLAGALESL